MRKDDYNWVKLEADLAEDFNFGWFLLKLRKGTHIEQERTLVNDEVWLPKRSFTEPNARVLGHTERVRIESIYSQYKKFTVGVKITYSPGAGKLFMNQPARIFIPCRNDSNILNLLSLKAIFER